MVITLNNYVFCKHIIYNYMHVQMQMVHILIICHIFYVAVPLTHRGVDMS